MDCEKCGAPLCEDERAINIKLFGGGDGGCFCIGCLAEGLKCSESDIERMIDRFRKVGCVLFPER